MIKIKCDCGENFQADIAHKGRLIRCNKCGSIIEIREDGRELSVSHPSKDGRFSSTGNDNRIFLFLVIVIGVIFFAVLFKDSFVFHSDLPSFPKESIAPRLPKNFDSPEKQESSNSPHARSESKSCPNNLVIRPVSSEELGREHRGGLGKVQILNGTSWDAVAVLVEMPVGVPQRAIYIRSGEVGKITQIPTGVYRLQFQFGRSWHVNRYFCEIFGTSEFAESFGFEEKITNQGVEYSTWEITLHPVPEGEARTSTIPSSDFQLPPL